MGCPNAITWIWVIRSIIKLTPAFKLWVKLPTRIARNLLSVVVLPGNEENIAHPVTQLAQNSTWKLVRLLRPITNQVLWLIARLEMLFASESLERCWYYSLIQNRTGLLVRRRSRSQRSSGKIGWWSNVLIHLHQLTQPTWLAYIGNKYVFGTYIKLASTSQNCKEIVSWVNCIAAWDLGISPVMWVSIKLKLRPHNRLTS